MKTILISILASLALGGGIVWFLANRPSALHGKTLVLLEATSSVAGDVRSNAHDAVETNAGSLERGDEMILVPITSDAATEAAGKVLRLRISNKRKAYDADLKQARAKLKTMLDQMRDDAVARPYKRTDLVGTLRLAAEERNTSDTTEVFTIIILSDMINDTPQLNFMTHAALVNESTARKFADQLMAGREKTWAGAHVFLGQLRSKDPKRVKLERRDAIRSFWIEYFTAGGAAEVIFATDGVG
ncbi:MAG: hypothetical protein ACRD8U_25225, partial [Pyrinomonadaceae bacterium]